MTNGLLAQGGLTIGLPSSVKESPPGCSNFTITLCNLYPNATYEISGTIKDSGGNIVHSFPGVTLTADSKGKISMAVCIVIGAGTYTLAGSASATGQTLTGDAELVVTT